MDNNMFYMPRSEPWDGEGFEPAPQKYLLSRTQSDQAARGLEGPGSYKTFPPKPANRGLTPGASQPPGHLPVAPQIACPPEQGFPDCYSPPPPHNRTAAPLRPVPPPRSSRIRGPVTSFSEARGENKPGRRRKKEVKKESSGPVTPTELVELGPRGPWYSSSGDDRSPFSGVGLRWHSGLAYSSSDAGSRPPPPRPNKAFQRSSSEEHTPSNHASCLQLGGTGRRKTPPGSRVRALITGQVDHRPNRDSYSSGVDRLSDFPFGVDEYAVQQHGPYGEENPQQQHYKQQQQQFQQQQQQQQLFHQNDYHTAHYTQQHPHVTRDVSEETFQRLPSGYPRVHDMPPASPNPSSYNFNNRVQPKRESLPKNFEDLDLSIKNEFEKIRKTYDKGRSDEDENRNRLSAKRNKTSSKRKPNNTSVRANGKNNSSNSNSNSNNNSNKNSSGKSRKSQALHNVFASHTANSEPRRQGSTSSRQDGTSPEKEKDLVSQKDSSRQQLRDDFDEKRRRRTRNHVIFLLVVLVVVAVAVLSAVLVATLGSSAGYMTSTTPASVTNYSVVVANMTLKILNRDFHPDLLQVGSDRFLDLASPYSMELDVLFLRSSLSTVYCGTKIMNFSQGSIYAASQMMFLDVGIVTSSQDVENVIKSAEVASPWKLGEAVRLGEFVVCRECVHTSLNFVTVSERPEVLLHSADTDLEFQRTSDLSDVTEKFNQTMTSSATNEVLLEVPMAASPTTVTATTSTTTSTAKTTTTTTTTTAAAATTTLSADATRVPSRARQHDVAGDVTTWPPQTAYDTTKGGPGDRGSGFRFEHTHSGTLTGSRRNTTLEPTVIRVSNVSALSTDNHVTVTCHINNPYDWSAVNLVHTSRAFEDSNVRPSQSVVRLDPTDLYVTATVSKVYSHRVRVSYDVSDTHIHIEVNISSLGCYDDGYVQCSLAGHTMDSQGQGRLKISVPASRPKLTVPVEVIENREMTPAIQCQADLGYPSRRLLLSAQLPGSDVSFPLPGRQETVRDGCRKYATLRATDYRPSLSSNGTVLRCAFEDSNSSLSEHGLVDERELLVIRESLCQGRADSTVLRHPYNCSYYITCQDQKPSVQHCVAGKCHDPATGLCGVQAVISEARDGVLNQGLAAITCSVIHVPDWSTISIQRVTSPSSSQDVLTVGRDGSTTWYDESLRMRALPEFRRSDLESVVTLWLSSSRCDDQGTYTCVVEGSGVRRRSHTKLRVFAPPARPSLSLPSLILQDSKAQLDISCDVTNLGRPRATITLERKLPHETGFTSLTFDDVTRVENGACMTSARGTYKTLVSRDLNGTIYRCVVRPAPGSGHLFEPTWAEDTLSLIPEDICESRGATLLPHPSQCRHFLQCSPGSAAMLLTCGRGVCFNVTSQQCDILQADSRFDTALAGIDNACYHSSDGSYLPHPSLCDKYFRCDQGKEVTQHCPPGTLYAWDGLCTKEVTQAYCFKKIL